MPREQPPGHCSRSADLATNSRETLEINVFKRVGRITYAVPFIARP